MKVGMECLRLLFIGGLLFNVATMSFKIQDDCPSDSSGYRLPVGVTECRHYNIKFSNPTISKDRNFYLEIEYFIEIHKTTKNISLHYNLQSLWNIIKNRTELIKSELGETYTPVRYIFCPATEILALEFENTLALGSYNLYVHIEDKPSNGTVPGLSGIVYNEFYNLSFFATNYFWNARSVFPCWNEPGSRATFNITVMHSLSETVLSNMPIIHHYMIQQSGIKLTRFQTTPLIPPHLVGIVIFENTNFSSNENMTMWGRPELATYLPHPLRIATQCANFIKTYMNLTENVLKMDHVAVPSSLMTNLNFWGLYTYKEQDFGYNKTTNNRVYIHDNTDMEYQIVQRVTNQMFSYTVSPSWWNYMWLNNGIATFLGLHITNELFSDLRIMDRFVVEDLQMVLSKDIASRVDPLMDKVETPQQIERVFSAVMQKKAAALVRMLYHYISGEVFRKGVNSYLNEHQFKSVTPDNFWEALRSVSSQFDWDLKENLMSKWLSDANYPVLNVAHLTEYNNVILRQHLYIRNRDEAKTRNWWIPITFATQSNLDFNNTHPIYWLTTLYGFLPRTAPGHGWVIFNVQQVGYYRVNYDMDNWQRLIAYLKYNDYKNIHPINRAQLIDDSYHLVLAGHLNSTVFLELSEYLKRERDYIPWYPMKRIFSNMSIFFRFPESESIKLHFAKILDDVFQDIGFENNDNDGHFMELLRLLLQDLMHQLDQHTFLSLPNCKLIEFFKKPEKNIDDISPAWRDSVFCSGMKDSPRSLWQKMLDEYMNTKKYQYLEYLNCAENSSIIIEYIDKLLSNNIPVLDDDNRLQIIHNILKKHVSKDVVLEYVLTRYNDIRFFVPFLIDILIENVYNAGQFEKLKEYVRDTEFYDPELETIVKFDQNLISKIDTQSNKIQTEVKMFTNLFKTSRISKTASAVKLITEYDETTSSVCTRS